LTQNTTKQASHEASGSALSMPSSTRHPRGPPIGLRCITSTASPGQCSHRARALTLTSVTRSHTPPAVQKWDCWSDCQPSLISLALSMPSIFSPSSHGHSQCPSDSPPSGGPSSIGRLDTSGYRTGHHTCLLSPHVPPLIARATPQHACLVSLLCLPSSHVTPFITRASPHHHHHHHHTP
jgi:hypothetical protein